MSAKHYRKIAGALYEHGAHEDLCRQIGEALAEMNPRFDMVRFLEAACPDPEWTDPDPIGDWNDARNDLLRGK